MRWTTFAFSIMVFVSSFSTAGAYTAVFEPVDTPYEVITITDDPMIERSILGELEGSPEMFEITSDVEFTLTVEIRAITESGTAPEFAGIVIRQKESRGVEEVARLRATDADWLRVIDSETGLPYFAGPFWSQSVPAGTYRIEVSTPENTGKYILVVGSQDDTKGYLESIRNVSEAYEFYDASTLRMFNSPYIHYPLGIILLIFLLGGTWWWLRSRIIHALTNYHCMCC